VLAAAFVIASVPAAFVEQMADSRLLAPAEVKYAFMQYQQTAPTTNYEDFLQENPQLAEYLGTVTPDTLLPTGTVLYYPMYKRNQ
jgi:hypothetical protein